MIHDDISSSQISSMAPVNLYLKKSDRVQIISSKMKGKNNYGVESFLEENMKFISKGLSFLFSHWLAWPIS